MPKTKSRDQIIEIHGGVIDYSMYSYMDWNLVCDRGHLHYSPEPMDWVGHECGIRFINNNGKRVTCRRKQQLLKNYKPARKPKPTPVKKKKPKWKVRKQLVPRY